jgi:hypothetical protein
MEDVEEEKAGNETNKKYLTIITLINGIENRLKWSELAYILMNFFVFFPSIYFISLVIHKYGRTPNPLDMLFIFFCHVLGISLNTHWMASSLRTQLKLKLRYFQARFLERKLNREGEFILADEAIFFAPEIGQVKAPDAKETLVYPTKGLLRMDGFVGSAKPRVLSLLLPSLFFVIYLSSFLSILGLLFLL